MDGLILVHKSPSLTSHDVVVSVRKIIGQKKVGHFGTLDPLATGLLLVAVGKATRLFPFYSKLDKSYVGQIRMGVSTDTYDSQGKPVSPEVFVFPEAQEVEAALKPLIGEIDQVPPPYSAKKHKGQPLYKLARKNQQVRPRPVRVKVYFFLLKDYKPPLLDFEVKCSSGTYLRSLAHDLGQALGCGAHLTRLERTEVGRFHLKDAFSLDELKAATVERGAESFLFPIENLLPDQPKVILNAAGVISARHGGTIPLVDVLSVHEGQTQRSSELPGKEIFRLFSSQGRFIALARQTPKKNGFHPFLVLSDLETDRSGDPRG